MALETQSNGLGALRNEADLRRWLDQELQRTGILPIQAVNGLNDHLDNAVTTAADLDGPGLTTSGSELAVDPGAGLEIDSDEVRIAAAAAGDGLTGGAGSALAVGAGDGLTVAADAVAVGAGHGIDVTADAVDVDETELYGSAVGVCQGRLTLVSGDAVPSADQTAKTTLYFTPYEGNRIDVYSGSAWVGFTFTEKSLALGTLASATIPNDIFIYDNAGTLTLEKLAWTNTTTRATALTTQDGVLVKSGATTRRYLGTFYPTATTTTEDSAAKRFLWNAYNRKARHCKGPTETTDSWTYTTNTWRQVRAASTNRFEYVCGVAEDSIEATATAYGQNSGAAAVLSTGIGVDSTSANSAQMFGHGTPGANAGSQGMATYRGVPGLGYHAINWLERSSVTSGTTTWFGDLGVDYFQTGIVGSVFA